MHVFIAEGRNAPRTRRKGFWLFAQDRVAQVVRCIADEGVVFLGDGVQLSVVWEKLNVVADGAYSPVN